MSCAIHCHQSFLLPTSPTQHHAVHHLTSTAYAHPSPPAASKQQLDHVDHAAIISATATPRSISQADLASPAWPAASAPNGRDTLAFLLSVYRALVEGCTHGGKRHASVAASKHKGNTRRVVPRLTALRYAKTIVGPLSAFAVTFLMLTVVRVWLHVACRLTFLRITTAVYLFGHII